MVVPDPAFPTDAGEVGVSAGEMRAMAFAEIKHLAELVAVTFLPWRVVVSSQRRLARFDQQLARLATDGELNPKKSKPCGPRSPA